jgi:hypothetical protein
MEPQSFANHTRWHRPFHFFVMPVLAINLIWSIVEMVLQPGWNTGRWVVVSAALVMLGFLARINPLKAQDRIIRLEETLRCQRLLPTALALQAGSLRPGQLIALRFAPDEEVEGIVRDVLAGKLNKPVEIKKAIKNWRADHFRV